MSERLYNNNVLFVPFSGVPGVKPERFEEGMKIKHCALSLVGKQHFLVILNRPWFSCEKGLLQSPSTEEKKENCMLEEAFNILN